MSLSLRQKYDDRAARVAQFFVLWLLIAAALFAFIGRFAGEHFFQIAKWWAVSSVSGQIPVSEQGQRYRADELFVWAVQNWPHTFEHVKFLAVYSFVIGLLFATGIFWMFSRTKTAKAKTERVRGARMLTAHELKKEIKK
jgi:magnesium-transporting ATPase (P-type)